MLAAIVLSAAFTRITSPSDSVLVLDVDPETRAIVAHTAEGVRTFVDTMLFEHRAIPWLRFTVAEDIDIRIP